MFLLWMAVFVVFSGLGGIASEGWLVIVARFVTGVAAGFMAPAGLSIITTSFPEGRERNRALLIYAGVAAAGFSLGMVVGGLLTAIGWRWVFFAPVRDGHRCCSSSRSASCRATAPRAAGQLRPRRRAGDHRGDDRARVHRRPRAGRRARARRSPGWPAAALLLAAFVRDRAPRAASRSCASASCANREPAARQRRHDAVHRRLRRLPVRRRALPAGAARLVAGRDRAGAGRARDRRDPRADAHPEARRALRQAARDRRRAPRWPRSATRSSCASAPTGPTSTCCRRCCSSASRSRSPSGR